MIYFKNADNLMNKRIELLIPFEIQNPDIVVVTEIFPKNIDSTNIYRYYKCNEIRKCK